LDTELAFAGARNELKSHSLSSVIDDIQHGSLLREDDVYSV
jgi:hypothetical protein